MHLFLVSLLLLAIELNAQQISPQQMLGATLVQNPSGHQTVTNLIPSISPFKCVEAYLSADTTYGGTDYGKAITAAVAASSLTTPTQIMVCSPGDHKVYTTATIDRPIALFAYGSRLIPQTSLSSTPITTSAVATAGSSTVVVSSALGLKVGMTVGGVGITPGSYITAISGNNVTLSLIPQLQFYAIATAGSSVIRGVSSMSGLATGKKLSGIGNWPFVSGVTNISSINPVNNTITLSSAATSGSITPNTFIVGDSWTTSLTAVSTKPVIRFIRNNAALQNQYTQMIGASMHGVWIADPDPNGRSLSGVQGVQISGYDGFNSFDLRIDNLVGSGEILGGNLTDTGQLLEPWTAVRESSFVNDQIRNSGDAHTGQAALAIHTPYEKAAIPADEINGINFIGGHYNCSNAIMEMP